MSEICLLITVVNSENISDFNAFFKKYGVNTLYQGFCNGTVQEKMLDLLGIEKTEKAIFFCVVYSTLVKKILSQLVSEMGLAMSDRGIALTVPINAVGGISSLKHITDGQEEIKEEVYNMIDSQFSLIIAIANKGSADIVMDCARKAGATGGTVINAKGTYKEECKFFGVSLASEKDMILIVSKRDDKDGIMKAIMQSAGAQSQCQTVLFSLPVDDIIGINSLIGEKE